MKRAPLVIALAACAVVLPIGSSAVAATLPVCSVNPETRGETLCATVRPPRAWAKASAYGASGYPIPRPRDGEVLRPLALQSIKVTKPDRIDEGECGTQVVVDARYKGGGKTLLYEYVEDDCGGFQATRAGETPVTVPGATVALASRSGGANVLMWTRASRADITAGAMIGTMMLRSSTLSRARLEEIAATIR
jgi:hypothetical protein